MEAAKTDLADAPARDAELPRMFDVVMLNDDKTPMDFVVLGLRKFFHHSMERATEIMLMIHHRGRGVAGTYPRDIAATKAAQMEHFARRHRYPLRCKVEPQKED